MMFIIFDGINMEIYYCAIDENVPALFASEQLEVLCRLIEQRKVRYLTKYQNDRIDQMMPAQMLAEQKFSIKELENLSYATREIVPAYSLRKLRRAKYSLETIYHYRHPFPHVEDLKAAG